MKNRKRLFSKRLRTSKITAAVVEERFGSKRPQRVFSKKRQGLKTTIDEYEFLQAFKKETRNVWSDYGMKGLFEYLAELEKETGEELEMDLAAFDLKYEESSYEELQGDYGSGTLQEEFDAYLEDVRSVELGNQELGAVNEMNENNDLYVDFMQWASENHLEALEKRGRVEAVWFLGPGQFILESK